MRVYLSRHASERLGERKGVWLTTAQRKQLARAVQGDIPNWPPGPFERGELEVVINGDIACRLVLRRDPQGGVCITTILFKSDAGLKTRTKRKARKLTKRYGRDVARYL